MIRHRLSWRALAFVVALFALLPAHAPAQTAEPKPETIRPEVGNPLKEAEKLNGERKYQEALVKVKEAEQVAERTPLENYFINRVRGLAAAGAGDTATATVSLEAVLAAGRSSPAEVVGLSGILASLYFRAADYPKAVTWTRRYLKEGGTNPQMRHQLALALYQSGDYAAAATEVRAMIDADEKAGKKPVQEQLLLLGGCYAKMKDEAGYTFALEKLLVFYPSKEYWADALARLETKPGFPDSLSLDLLRLQEATGNLTSRAQYAAMIQLALKSGYPAEAKRVVEQGFKAGVLGTGATADADRKLRDSAITQAADDERAFARDAQSAAAARDGTGLVNTGWALVTAGQAERGLAMMEQGMQKGGIARPEEARLRLGLAYLTAGQKAKAIETFKSVQGTDATAELARLWTIHAQRPAG